MDALSGIGGTSTGSLETKAVTGLAEDFDSFLNLLTTQLQNQDPTEPLDTNQLTDQIVQFTQAEQLINTNQKLDQLVQLQSASTASNAVSYVGRVVEVESDEFNLVGGFANFGYELDYNAKDVEISITTPAGTVISTIDGPTTSDKKHRLTWNGTDKNGNPVADGIYKISIVAKDSDGKEIGVTPLVSDVVTDLDIKDGETTLYMGDIEIPVTAVRSINYRSIDNASQPGSDPSAGIANAVSYIDRVVEARTDTFNVSNGDGNIYYQLAKDAADVKISIVDSSGTVVNEIDGINASGIKHALNWDGTNSEGNQVDDGLYRIQVTAEDINGAEIDVSTLISGVVNEVDFANGFANLHVGGNTVPLSQVISIRNNS